MQTLTVVNRTLFGRKVKNLRKGGILPANIYGKKIKSQSVEVNLGEFAKVFKDAGETQVIELKLGREKRPVLIHNLQENPVTDQIIHVDFLQVDLKVKVTAKVPVELIGESPSEKEGTGVVVLQVGEIEVEALPGDLPEKFEVDLSPLVKVDDAIYIKDVKVDVKKVVIKNEPEQIIVKVEEPKKEEEQAPAPVVVAEGEATKEGEEAQLPQEEIKKDDVSQENKVKEKK